MKKVIVVGAGNWGKNLIRNFYELNALAGVAEVNDQLRKKVESTYPKIQTYSHYEQVLAADSSAIVLATPAPFHYQMAKQALEAGKDVFVEKPMTLQTDEAKELAQYAEQHQQILMVGHLLLYQPAIAWMTDYLNSGKAGKVLHVYAKRLKLGKVRTQENVWWSFAPHDVSVVLDLLGNPPLETVQATGQAWLQSKIEDNVHVDLTFSGGKTAHIHCSWYYPILERNTTVITERQMLVYDEVSQTVTVYEKRVDENLNNRDEGNWTADVTHSAPLKIECEHFLNSIETRQTPRSDGWNGLAVVEILEQAQKQLSIST